MATILIPIATGFEEIEAVSLIDVLRRADIEVLVKGIGADEIEGANKIVLKTDGVLDENINVDMLDMIVLPGGWGGTDVLAKDKTVQNLLAKMDEKGKSVGAICAAPFALNTAGVLKEQYTCYPSVEQHIKKDGYTDSKKVVSDKNVMTSRGPGTAICFGIEIVRKFAGDDVADGLKEGLLATYC